MFDPEAGQGAADLGQPPTIGGAARGRRVHGPVRAVGVQRQRQPIAVQHGAQGGHHRRHTLAADPQLGIQQLLGGVVDCGDQLEEPRASRRCSMGRGDGQSASRRGFRSRHHRRAATPRARRETQCVLRRGVQSHSASRAPSSERLSLSARLLDRSSAPHLGSRIAPQHEGTLNPELSLLHVVFLAIGDAAVLILRLLCPFHGKNAF